MAEPLYLDHNATTPLRPVAQRAIADAFAATGNPSSVHGFGRAQRRLIEDAREAVAALAGASAESVVFTSGGTEANTLALLGAGCRRVLVSAVEHDSVLAATEGAVTIPVDGNGVVEVPALEALLAEAHTPALVSVMLANNETGVIQPVAAVAEAAHRFGALVHCDAVQCAGKLAFAIDDLGVDMLSLSAHKLGGPQGTGALIVRAGTEISPVIRGGGQERGLRAGTEAVALIAGFGAAAAEADETGSAWAEIETYRDRIEAHVANAAPDARIFGRGAPRLANTSCLAMPGVANEVQVMAFDLTGIAISAGAACSSGTVGPSHVLAAMGVPEAGAGSAIRVSLGWTTCADDADRFAAAWTSLYERLAPRAPDRTRAA
ncbi:MAG: cysteine desulfurase family protein [Rhodospirillales bacterium]|jgi:cysteine desulfurase|nr:cysteine desulfurase family protein [Rhodospirillales bacterium]MDP6805771.1 cysteine desulfurase family protein [Rhodospirillales bacterium]